MRIHDDGYIEVDLPPPAEAQDWNPDLSGDIDYIIPFPCIARDIQQWILETSIKPQPALALAASLMILSLCIGRNLVYDGIKGNLLILGLAGSGEGKDWPLKAIDSVLECVDLLNNVRSDMASGAALFEAVNECKSVLLSIDEAGHYFAGVTGKGSNQYSREIMPMITKMYTSASGRFVDKARKSVETQIIKEPFVSVFGMSTERKLLDSVTSSEVEDGSMARFIVMFGQSNVPINQQRKRDKCVPKHIIEGLKALREKHEVQFAIDTFSTEIETSSEFDALKLELDIYFNNKAINYPDYKAMFKPMLNRLSVMAVQWAILIDQCRSVDVLRWCANLLEKNSGLFEKKFMHLCADNEHEAFSKLIQATIKESGLNGISRSDFTRKTQRVPKYVKDGILKDLLDAGLIFVGKSNDSAQGRNGERYYWKK